MTSINRSSSSYFPPLFSEDQEFDQSTPEDEKMVNLWSQALEMHQTVKGDSYQDVELEGSIGLLLDNYEPERAYGSSDDSDTEPDKPPEWIALNNEREFQREVGKFLLQNAKFRLAYSVIIERLKNDLIGRATVASGYLKKEAFYESSDATGFVKAAEKMKLFFFKTTVFNAVTTASGLIGAACGITAIAASGVSFGGSLALELVPNFP